MSSKKVLFLGHDASRTGAPLLLLELLKWVSRSSDIAPSLLLKSPGPVESAYRAAVSECHCRGDYAPKISFTMFHRILRKLKLETIRQPDLNQIYPVSDYPVIYANTIATLDLAKVFAVPSRRCILHVHELNYSIQSLFMEQALRESSAFVSQYVAASEAVRANLIERFGLPPERISVIHEFPISYLKTTAELTDSRQAIRAAFGVSDEAFVVGMCGTMDWRKGIDLFLQMALQLRKTLNRPFLCVWVGGNPSDPQIKHDIILAGLEKFIRIEPSSPNPERYFPGFDVFALTSREDPFPVAMLEAAASGVPIVAFHGGGGAPELVGADAGRLVPYMDTIALAAAVCELGSAPEATRKLGIRAQEKVRALYTLDFLGPKVLDVISSLLPAGKP